jgi:large subunit ribosomal protein L35
MERVHQMQVVPDILPEIRPSVDLRLVVKADGVEQMRLHDNAVFLYEPGAFLRPKNVSIYKTSKRFSG